VQARYERLLAAWAERRGEAGTLAEAVDRFVGVTASYRPGLLHCYRVGGLPRTNNGLEQLFGAHRHHERRATGRKAASPALVLRGAVRLVAGVVTRARPVSARELAVADGGRSCGPVSSAAAGRGSCAAGSGATRTPISPGSSSTCSSQLCRPSFFGSAGRRR